VVARARARTRVDVAIAQRLGGCVCADGDWDRGFEVRVSGKCRRVGDELRLSRWAGEMVRSREFGRYKPALPAAR